MEQKKYQNLSGYELSQIKGMLDRINTQIGVEGMHEILSDIINRPHLPRYIKPNTYYYININKPFAESDVLRSGQYTGAPKKIYTNVNNKKEFSFVPVMQNVPSVLNCIGVSDSEGKRIYLLGTLNNEQPPYLFYKSDFWYLRIPGITYYKIISTREKGQYKSYTKEIIDSENPIHGLTVHVASITMSRDRVDTPMIVDITDIKKYFAEYTRYNEAHDKKLTAEIKKQTEVLNTYKNIGNDSPSGMLYNDNGKTIMDQISNDPDATWEMINLRDTTSKNYGTHHGVDLVYCDKYKVYYTSHYDTSD